MQRAMTAQFRPQLLLEPHLWKFYGAGRITYAAHARRRALNIQGLGAFDLRTLRPDGEPWDFRKQHPRDEATDYVTTQKPEWIIGWPTCAAFGAWMQLKTT